MKGSPLLFLTLAIVSIACATETQTRVGERDVTVIREENQDSPKNCHTALLESVKKQGWHDEIYNSVDKDKAYLVFSQRIVERGAWTKTRITFWKAIKSADGKFAINFVNAQYDGAAIGVGHGGVCFPHAAWDAPAR